MPETYAQPVTGLTIQNSGGQAGDFMINKLLFWKSPGPGREIFLGPGYDISILYAAPNEIVQH